MSFVARLRRLVMGELILLDEEGNVLILDGSAHITISADCGARYVHSSQPCLFCRLVCGFIQRILGIWWPHLKTHCHNAYVAELPVINDRANLA